MRTLAIVASVIICVSIIVCIVILLVSPKQTTISPEQKKAALFKLLGRQPILTQIQQPTGFKIYSGTYLSLNYPAAAKMYPYDENVDKKGVVVENFQFQQTQPRYHAVMQVLQQDIASIDDASGVQLRKTESGYVQSSLSVQSGMWVIFTKQDDMFEKTGFLLREGKLYTVSLSGSDPAIATIFAGIVKSVKIQ